MTATIGLLFGRKYVRSDVAGVFLDATISEDHTYVSRVTQFPIENGRVITDHVINEPDTLSLTGIVSDSPLEILSPFNRSVDAFNRLIRIHELKERITVVTGIKVYDNMIMTSLSVPRNLESGQALTFVMEFQKVLLDSTVQLNLNANDPFNKATDRIPREQVADASNYPFINGDPPLSLKDQASSGVDAGIQNLQPILPSVLPSILNELSRFRGFL